MGRTARRVAVAAAVVTLAVACAKAPYTDRAQLILIPKATMAKLGKQSYADMLKEVDVERGTDDAKRLGTVARRVGKAADEPDYAWESSLIKDRQINAFALPGGYIGFYKGILPVLHNESGMAFVMGHEVGHAIANHGAERMTAQLGLQGALTVVDMFLSGRTGLSKKEENLVLGALGLGLQVGVAMPFNRKQEREADIIGLMLMADAGYPPGSAPQVWTRMEEIAGKGPPAFLSDHPSHDQRAATMKEYLPEAKKRYQRSERLGDTVKSELW